MSAYAGLAQGIRDRTKMAYEDAARAQEIQARKDMIGMQIHAEDVRAGAEAFDKFMANIRNPEAYRFATQQLHFDQAKPWAWRDEGIPKLTAMMVTMKPARTETRPVPADNSLDTMKSPDFNAPVLPTETVPAPPSSLPMLKSAFGVSDAGTGVPADLYGGINPSAASQGAEAALRQAFDTGQVQKAMGVDQPQQVPIADPGRNPVPETINIPAVTAPAFDTTTIPQAGLDVKDEYNRGRLQGMQDTADLNRLKAVGKGEIDPNAHGSVGPAAASRFAVDQARIADYTTKANQRTEQLKLEWQKLKETGNYHAGMLGVAKDNAGTARQNAGTNAGRLGVAQQNADETTAYHNFLRTKAMADIDAQLLSGEYRREEIIRANNAIIANPNLSTAEGVIGAKAALERLGATAGGKPVKTPGPRPNATMVGAKPAGDPWRTLANIEAKMPLGIEKTRLRAVIASKKTDVPLAGLIAELQSKGYR